MLLLCRGEILKVRVLVYEYFCGGGLAGRELPERWASDGWAMLAAVVEDLAALPTMEVLSSMDARLVGRRLAAAHVLSIGDAAQERDLFVQTASQCDGVLVIAPELDGILHQRCRWVESSGGRLLGPSAQAVALTSDKFTLNRLLAQHDVPVPEARLLSGQQLPDDFVYPAVLKPRFGAGSENVMLVEQSGVSVEEVQATLHGLWQGQGSVVLEEYVVGRPASVSFLVGPAGAVPLLAGLQRFGDGAFMYQGGRMPLLGPEALAAVGAAGGAVAAVTGLRGFVGVDVVVSLPASDAELPAMPSATVIEINPRLTTSYVGLRALARGNVAGWMLDVLEGRQPHVAWQRGEVEFDADGTVRRGQAEERV